MKIRSFIIILTLCLSNSYANYECNIHLEKETFKKKLLFGWKSVNKQNVDLCPNYGLELDFSNLDRVPFVKGECSNAIDGLINVRASLFYLKSKNNVFLFLSSYKIQDAAIGSVKLSSDPDTFQIYQTEKWPLLPLIVKENSNEKVLINEVILSCHKF
jgi:hypothetical protein